MPRVWELRIRRDYANRWMETNPILADGEPGYEKDTCRLKVGDGVRPWDTLRYIAEQSTEPEPLDDAAIIQIVSTYLYNTVPSDPEDGPSLSLLYENAKV